MVVITMSYSSLNHSILHYTILIFTGAFIYCSISLYSKYLLEQWPLRQNKTFLYHVRINFHNPIQDIHVAFKWLASPISYNWTRFKIPPWAPPLQTQRLTWKRLWHIQTFHFDIHLHQYKIFKSKHNNHNSKKKAQIC